MTVTATEMEVVMVVAVTPPVTLAPRVVTLIQGTGTELQQLVIPTMPLSIRPDMKLLVS